MPDHVHAPILPIHRMMGHTDEAPSSPSPKRKRASRKGQPRKFSCPEEGCGKAYSRAEHLARHQLNHNPKRVYRCEVLGCNHTFVRPDLFARHKARHEDPGADGQEHSGLDLSHERQSLSTSTAEWSTGGQNSNLQKISTFQPATIQPASESNGTQNPFPRWRQDASSHPVLTPESSTTIPTRRDPVLAPSSVEQQAPWFGNETLTSIDDVHMNGDHDNFATWLFDSPDSQNNTFDFANVPFMDFGMEFGSSEMWSFDEPGIDFGNVNGTRPYSTTSTTSDNRIVDAADVNPHKSISGERREALVALLSSFMKKKAPRSDLINLPESILFGADEWPNLTIPVLESCLIAFWRDTSVKMPIVHQPTFSANACEPLLLLAIIAIGAAAIVRSKPKDALPDYKVFADFIITNLRWELFTHDDAQPPVHLWVAQTLLFLEFYEKLCSTRQLHERAHIHHASTLTLLRRGNPMVGRSGSETPPSETPTRPASPVTGTKTPVRSAASETRSWWKRWASNESMNRVVFAAFEMDTLHACMFGHSADILPHELRLPLPCDDSLWTAKSGEEVRRLESTFAMYRIKQVNFLDGLKRCLHGYEVQTHHFARMILMAGLLSVGWHINRREKNLQFVETVPSVQEQARWRSLLLQAFGHWRRSFSEVLDLPNHRTNDSQGAPARDSTDPTTLFHLAHLTMHVDIIDIQILTGPKRLQGRKVSEKDMTAVVQRMRVWASSSMARHAILHAFKVLHTTLCHQSNPMQPSGAYNCRNDPAIYRPWILYLAGLTIWAYQYLNTTGTRLSTFQQSHAASSSDLACQYISSCAATDNEDRIPLLLSDEGCISVLHVLSHDFANSESELVLEASKRLQECVKMLHQASLNSAPR